MTDKEKILAEIERLYNQSLADENRQADRGLERAANVSYGKSIACKELLSFINTLPKEPVSEDLEDAAIKYADENTEDPTEMNEYDSEYFDWHDYCERVYKAGAQWQKEQMMKDAVDATLAKTEGMIWIDNTKAYNKGDKVKVIIIKEG